MASPRTATEALLPVAQVAVRPGRLLAVHHRQGTGASKRHRLFFVHGSCASMLQYEPMISAFAKAGHEVIAYDFLGCGRSPKPDDWYAYALDELRADLAAVVALYGGRSSPAGDGPPTKNVLVCHSMGCLLGLCVAGAPTSAAAAQVDALCLLGAFAPVPKPHPIMYLPATVLGWIQPKLSAAFEAAALHPKTHEGASEARQRALALSRELNASNPSYMFKAYYRQARLSSLEQV